MKEIRRKHFRFPAYDDKSGVKLKKNQRRILFEGHDDLMNEMNKQPLFEQMQEFHFGESSVKEQRKRQNLRDTKKTSVQKEILVQHKENLPNYYKDRKMTPTSIKISKSSSKYNGQEKSLDSLVYRKNRRNTIRNRSYFVPKYVPASIIPEPKIQNISDDELIHSMKKTKDSYLLFDDDSIPYQEKKIEKTSVKLGNKSEKKSPNQRKKEKNHGVLERSLQGLIEEQENSLGENSYFK
ncbi:hypothetical protein AALA44_01275 [Enterococcus ratti]|uniref:hypothetical protein n=1 Tax=Enterococcus ratti TaxID=150033 RepID=UPI0035184326